MIGIAIVTLLGTAQAQSTSVLIAPFAPSHPEAAGLAVMLPDFVGQQLDARRDITVLSIDDIPRIADVSARNYAESCPDGEQVGCAFVLAEAAGAELAITGEITAYDNNTLVDIHIIETLSARELIVFQVHYGPGDDLIFAEGIARVVQAIMRGDIGREADIRSFGRPGAQGPDAEQATADLSQLDQEIGGVDSIDAREEGIVARESYSMDDFASDMDSEGTKPWERLDMSPREFLRYKNSGRPLYEWRELAEGRRGQILLRGFGGFGRIPASGEYYGRVALSAQTLDVAEVYAWQTAANGSGGVLGASVGYGLTPELEVGLNLGLGTGRFLIDIHRVTEGDFSSAPAPTDDTNQALFAGPQVLYAFLPTSSFRPVLGGFVHGWLGTSVDNHLLPPAELPNGGDPAVPSFSAPLSIVAGAIGGFEVQMGDRLDLWVHVPVGAVVATLNAPSKYTSGGGVLEDLKSPPEQGVASTGIHVGVQVRAFGGKEKAASLEDY
ncbi:MAG: hypothetical protein ACI8S6_002311 [Myxococcota bacterium]|jgi:hypothetical protein